MPESPFDYDRHDATDDDTEGHRLRRSPLPDTPELAEDADDTEGHRLRDTSGRRVRRESPHPDTYDLTEDADDTEGHRLR